MSSARTADPDHRATLTISVVIASRDRLSHVRDLVADLSDQTYPVAEIIVVDQSTRPYGDIDGVMVVRDEGRGPCRSRNIGAGAASGDVLVFVDDDARIEPDFIEVLCDPILRGRVVAATGSMCEADGRYPDSPGGWTTETRSWIAALTSNPKRPGCGTTLSFSTACSALLSRTFDSIGGFDTYFDPNGAGEDREMGLRLFAAGHPIAYQGDARLHHLAVGTGGRRDAGHPRLNILQANLYYVVAKHFGPDLAAEYRRWWRREVWRRTAGSGVRRAPRAVRDLRSLDRHCSAVNELLATTDDRA